jgi:FemAB-related protein (PEP-CTERM system-associated)
MSRAALLHIGQPEADPVEIHAAVDAAAWDTYVNRHPEATIYQLWMWRDVFERAFGHRCIYLTATRAGRTVGVLPLVLFTSRLFGRFMVSLPFVNYGGLLADDADIAAALTGEAARYAGEARASHVELRHRRRMLDGLPVKQHKVAMVMPLAPTADAVWAGLDRKVRNQIRKAEKSGLTATSGGAELLADFYAVFAHNMRDLGTPVYTPAFFAEVFRRCADRARVYLVRDQRRVVAAGISLQFRNGIEVPWAASLASYRPTCPNHLLYWSVIRAAVASGSTALDFGRSTPDEGTFHFKRQWGAVAQPLYWEYLLLTRSTLPDHSPRNPRFMPAIAIWKRLPVSVTRWLGPHIVRSIP